MYQYEKTSADGSAQEDLTDNMLPEASADWTADWFSRLYQELRALAHAQRRRFRDDSAPGTTSIVHEAYERLQRAPNQKPEHALHFYRTAARTMRSVLIDNARRARAVMHGGDLQRLPSAALELVSVQRSDELLALDEALAMLHDADAALAELVQLRVFAGLTVDELAALLEVSSTTIKRRWKAACLWLYATLESSA